VYKLPTDRIYATYFGGNEKAGLTPDSEALELVDGQRIRAPNFDVGEDSDSGTRRRSELHSDHCSGL
ncbi:hypothetical protein TIFTF001_048764, partial [Ficus carica]